MPSRGLSVLIVLFWLAFNGWLLCHDIVPRLLPGQPPPYSIELVEEARTSRAYILWSVEKDGERIAQARTGVEHPSRNVFELVSTLTPPIKGVGFRAVDGLLIHKMQSTYRVDETGDLLGLEVLVDAKGDPTHPLLRWMPAFHAAIEGEVDDGTMAPRLTVQFPEAALSKKEYSFDFQKVKLPRGGSVLLPLHPVNRLRGLRPGQSWTMQALDPLSDLLGALPGIAGRDATFQGDLRLLRASVRQEEVLLSRDRYHDVPCLVIDYDGDMQGSTWVARKTGLVMRQEAFIGKTHWAMYRD
jgi:hypothetical protein